jgi:hypothetical protein
MTGAPAKRRLFHHGSFTLIAVLIFLGGCSSTPHQSRPFFLSEENTEGHGRKTWFDRLIELDPGGTPFRLADDYLVNPPLKIVILPFADHGNGDYMVNKLPLTARNEKERNRWSWTHANRLRRSVAGSLATREFTVVPLLAVDAVLADRGITNMGELNAVTPQELGRWLDADTVVYGDLLSYEAYYGFLVAAWKVTAAVRMVSTLDGREVFACASTRYSTDVNLVLDPIDIAINSVLSLIQLRDIWLARTEYEVGSEIILRLPISQHGIFKLQAEARERSRGFERDARQAAAERDTGQPGVLASAKLENY